MSYHDKQNPEVAALIERLSLDTLTISTDGDEPSIYVHCGRDLTLSEWRAIEGLAMELWAADMCARGEL